MAPLVSFKCHPSSGIFKVASFVWRSDHCRYGDFHDFIWNCWISCFSLLHFFSKIFCFLRLREWVIELVGPMEMGRRRNSSRTISFLSLGPLSRTCSCILAWRNSSKWRLRASAPRHSATGRPEAGKLTHSPGHRNWWVLEIIDAFGFWLWANFKYVFFLELWLKRRVLIGLLN